MVALGYKMAPPQRVLGLNHRSRWKIFKNLLQNHLPQMFEIRYVALPGGLLPRGSGDGVVDNTLDYQSRGRKIDPPLLQSFG